MDRHQKISIGIFGALLLGTMAMYSTGNLSSSFINNRDLIDGKNPCPEAFPKNYTETYESHKAKIIELQQFVGRNCGGDVVESKRSYCDARTKQIENYSQTIKRYEQCMSSEVTVGN